MIGETKLTQAEIAPGLMMAQTTIKTGDTISNTTTETDFQTNYPVKANTLEVGAIITIKGTGWYNAPLITAGTSVLKLKLGSTTLLTSPSMTNLLGASAAGFTFEVMFTVLSVGATGTIQVHGDFLFTTASGMATPTVMASPTPVVIDTTVDANFKASIKFGVASSNLNATLSQFKVNAEGPARIIS